MSFQQVNTLIEEMITPAVEIEIESVVLKTDSPERSLCACRNIGFHIHHIILLEIVNGRVEYTLCVCQVYPVLFFDAIPVPDDEDIVSHSGDSGIPGQSQCFYYGQSLIGDSESSRGSHITQNRYLKVEDLDLYHRIF